MKKTVCQLDRDGYFLAAASADPSPLERGVWLLPYGCVDAEPPDVPPGQRARFVDGGFVLEAIPQPPPPPEPLPPSVEQLKTASIAKVKELRRIVFAALAGLQSEAIASGDTTTASGILPVQAALRDLPATDLSACQTQADIDATFLAAWLAIVSITPLNVVSAFNDVL